MRRASPSAAAQCAAVLLLAAVVCPTHAHDVVEALLFEDDQCYEPVGRIVVVADGACRCVQCAHTQDQNASLWATPAPPRNDSTGDAPTPDGPVYSNTTTFTLSLRPRPTPTETLSHATPTRPSRTESATVPTATEVVVTPTLPLSDGAPGWRSSELGEHAIHSMRPSLRCAVCSLSTSVRSGAARCNAAGDAFTITLHEHAGTCPAPDTVERSLSFENKKKVLKVGSQACLYLGEVDGTAVYGLLAPSTCQRAPEKDESVSDLEKAFIAVVVVFAVGLLVAIAVAVFVHFKTQDFVRLKSEFEKSQKENNNVSRETGRLRDAAEDVGYNATSLAGVVEEVTGKNTFNNGLCEAAMTVPPPALPLKEELADLAAKMAEMEDEVHLQQRIQRDAMI